MWISVDGDPVHLNCREPLTPEETEALVEVIRAARAEMAKRPPPPYVEQARELRERLDAEGMSIAEAWRRWPQCGGIGKWSRMLAGVDDPGPALAEIAALREITQAHLGSDSD